MQAFKVRLYTLPVATKLPNAPTPAPKERPGFAVDAEDIDGARHAAALRLAELGHTVRAISCLAGNEAQLAAVVYERAPLAPEKGAA